MSIDIIKENLQLKKKIEEIIRLWNIESKKYIELKDVNKKLLLDYNELLDKYNNLKNC